MTLWDLKQGKSGVVQDFNPKLPSNYATRLTELGFKTGSPVSCVLATSLGAPRLYRVENAVYSLDDHVAKLIDMNRAQ
jgi:ferrous iron transport protein A